MGDGVANCDGMRKRCNTRSDYWRLRRLPGGLSFLGFQHMKPKKTELAF